MWPSPTPPLASATAHFLICYINSWITLIVYQDRNWFGILQVRILEHFEQHEIKEKHRFVSIIPEWHKNTSIWVVKYFSVFPYTTTSNVLQNLWQTTIIVTHYTNVWNFACRLRSSSISSIVNQLSPVRLRLEFSCPWNKYFKVTF